MHWCIFLKITLLVTLLILEMKLFVKCVLIADKLDVLTLSCNMSSHPWCGFALLCRGDRGGLTHLAD